MNFWNTCSLWCQFVQPEIIYNHIYNHYMDSFSVDLYQFRWCQFGVVNMYQWNSRKDPIRKGIITLHTEQVWHIHNVTFWKAIDVSSPYLVRKYSQSPMSVCRPIWSRDLLSGTHSITPHCNHVTNQKHLTLSPWLSWLMPQCSLSDWQLAYPGFNSRW